MTDVLFNVTTELRVGRHGRLSLSGYE